LALFAAAGGGFCVGPVELLIVPEPHPESMTNAVATSKKTRLLMFRPLSLPTDGNEHVLGILARNIGGKSAHIVVRKSVRQAVYRVIVPEFCVVIRGGLKIEILTARPHRFVE
jgi:hypothetical protein